MCIKGRRGCADVTALCRRVIVIHHGSLLYDGELDALTDRIAPLKLVDIAAPGVDVYSSWSTTSPGPQPGTRYRRLRGTSMATPHVAGVAALLAEANPRADAHQLWAMLTQLAQRLPLPNIDVGSGLVQAP